MADLDDRVLDRLYNLAQIDAEWSIRTERGFTWWAGDLAQHVWADRPVNIDDHLLTRVHVRTDLVQGFDGTAKQLQVVGLLARYATASGCVRHAEDASRLQLAAAVSIHEAGFHFLTSFLSLAAAIQVAEAHISIPIIKAVDGWSIAQSAHPENGHCRNPDDMLHVMEGLPLRQEASRWAGDEMIDVLRMLREPPSILASGDETGVAAEFSFPDPRGSLLLRISTTDEHPRLGGGCLFRLTLPPSVTLASVPDLLDLNEREAGGHNYFLGSWCPAEEGPTYVSFLPNAAYRPGALQNLAMSLVNRARWVTAERFDHDLDDNYEKGVARKKAQLSALTRARFGPAPMSNSIDLQRDAGPADAIGPQNDLSIQQLLGSRREGPSDEPGLNSTSKEERGDSRAFADPNPAIEERSVWEIGGTTPGVRPTVAVLIASLFGYAIGSDMTSGEFFALALVIAYGVPFTVGHVKLFREDPKASLVGWVITLAAMAMIWGFVALLIFGAMRLLSGTSP